MSVCFFGADELGNVAAWLAREVDGDLQDLAQMLAAYSVGNAATFRYRYQDAGHTTAHSARAIEAAAIDAQESRKVDAGRARSTIQLLSYNGPEGEGLEVFRGQVAYRKAMVNLLGRAYAKVNRLLETKERGVGWEVGFGAGQD